MERFDSAPRCPEHGVNPAPMFRPLRPARGLVKTNFEPPPAPRDATSRWNPGAAVLFVTSPINRGCPPRYEREADDRMESGSNRFKIQGLKPKDALPRIA